MSHQFSNFLPAPVVLNQAGNLLQIPAGWTGSLNLTGLVEVGMSTASTVTTNTIPGSGNGLDTGFGYGVTSGYVATFVPNSGAYPAGSTVQWAVGFEQDTLFFGTLTIPEAQQLHVEFNVSSPSQLAYTLTTNAWPGATNYTTNLTAGALLGSYEATTALRAVDVTSSGLQTHDYSAEATAATAGFLLAVTIASFRYVLRLVRGVTEQGGDF